MLPVIDVFSSDIVPSHTQTYGSGSGNLRCNRGLFPQSQLTWGDSRNLVGKESTQYDRPYVDAGPQ